jgi:hypothetical protein
MDMLTFHALLLNALSRKYVGQIKIAGDNFRNGLGH